MASLELLDELSPFDLEQAIIFARYLKHGELTPEIEAWAELVAHKYSNGAIKKAFPIVRAAVDS